LTPSDDLDSMAQPDNSRADLELDELVRGYSLGHSHFEEAPGVSPLSLIWTCGALGHDDPELAELVNGCTLALYTHIEALHLAPALPENPLPAFDEWRGVNVEPFADSLQLIFHTLSEAAYTLGLDSEVLVMSVVLIERLMRAVGTERVPLRPRNVRWLLATALSLAAKTYYDEPVGLADIQGFLLEDDSSTASLAACELQFLALIKYGTMISAGVFQQYRSAILELLEAKYNECFLASETLEHKHELDVDAHQNQRRLSATSASAAASTLIFWQCHAVG
jgi:hypothetical protein